jgi:hypothetical protein
VQHARGEYLALFNDDTAATLARIDSLDFCAISHNKGTRRDGGGRDHQASFDARLSMLIGITIFHDCCMPRGKQSVHPSATALGVAIADDEAYM